MIQTDRVLQFESPTVPLPDGVLTGLALNFGQEPNTGFYRKSAGVWAFVVQGVEAALLTSSGFSSITPGLFGDGTVAAPSLGFAADTDTGFYRIGGNTVGVAVGGQEAVRWTSSKNTLAPTSAYYNYGTTEGASGYGFRDNAGAMEFKNAAGAWTGIGSGGGGSATSIETMLQLGML